MVVLLIIVAIIVLSLVRKGVIMKGLGLKMCASGKHFWKNSMYGTLKDGYMFEVDPNGNAVEKCRRCQGIRVTDKKIAEVRLEPFEKLLKYDFEDANGKHAIYTIMFDYVNYYLTKTDLPGFPTKPGDVMLSLTIGKEYITSGAGDENLDHYARSIFLTDVNGNPIDSDGTYDHIRVIEPGKYVYSMILPKQACRLCVVCMPKDAINNKAFI